VVAPHAERGLGTGSDTEALSATVGSSFLKSGDVALLTSVPSSVTDRLDGATAFKLQDLWWTVFVVAVGCGPWAWYAAGGFSCCADVDEGLRKLLEAGTEY
jgi:hypothetical protein